MSKREVREMILTAERGGGEPSVAKVRLVTDGAEVVAQILGEGSEQESAKAMWDFLVAVALPQVARAAHVEFRLEERSADLCGPDCTCHPVH